jgi:hypothetical protein
MRDIFSEYCSLATRHLNYMLTNSHVREGIDAILQNGAVSTSYFALPPAAIANVVYSANGGDIPKTFDNIARSLTGQIRSGPQSLNIDGEVWRTELYMSVDWPWLAYPVALLTAVCTSLIKTLVVSENKTNAH